MLWVNRYQYDAREFAGKLGRAGGLLRRKHVMGFVDDQPMRAPVLESCCLQSRHQVSENCRPVLQFDSDQVDYDIRIRGFEDLQDLLDRGRMLLVTGCDAAREIFVIAFGINETDLVRLRE